MMEMGQWRWWEASVCRQEAVEVGGDIGVKRQCSATGVLFYFYSCTQM
jgi:hypothetical protein